MSRERWMALLFAGGSICFLIGPFPGYAGLVGDAADAVTFFVGSILFTLGGLMQTLLAAPERRLSGVGRAAWWAATVQSAGTLFFNVTTYRAMHTALSSSEYNRLVWRPDALGSICFLVSGAIAYRAAPRQGLAAGARRAGLVGAGGELARLPVLRHLGRGWPRRSLDGLDARSGGLQLEHVAGRGLFPGLRAGDAAQRSHAEVAALAPTARARASGRAGRPRLRMNTGYSGTPLVRKLGIKPGQRVAFISAPAAFGAALGELPEGVHVLAGATRAGSLDVIVAFFTRRSALERRLGGLIGRIDRAGGLWIAWPKRSSGVASDVSEDVVRDLGLAAGVVDNKVCAIDETWSALRLVIRLRDR